MTAPKLTILGGSSPFTAALLELLPRIGKWKVMLYGRDVESLEAVAAYGRRVAVDVGGSLDWTTDLAEALDAAQIVLHQIRYGGLAGRADDERLAANLGVPADETLGPSGLQAAIRMASQIIDTAQALCERCSDAWVINLTNPLSCSTAILAQAGVRRVVGVCELPVTTLREACKILGVSEADVIWDYIGLNHRGFLHGMRIGDRDLLEELPQRLGNGTVGGTSADTIAELHALPLKYFRLIREASPSGIGRAAFLERLRREVLKELRREPGMRPPSLMRRNMAWYTEAVIPVLGALADDGSAAPQVVNLVGDDDLARETRATLTPAAVAPLPSGLAPGAARQWLDRFEEHERCVLAAALDPTRQRIRAALEIDPLLPGHLAEQATILVESGQKRATSLTAAPVLAKARRSIRARYVNRATTVV